MEIESIPIYLIEVGTRQRPIDDGKVHDLAQSIERQGLLQPIGVKMPENGSDRYPLIFGAHRVRAFQELRRPHIPAYILPPDLQPEEYLLIELQENCVRNDLTGAQRKAYTAEVARLLSTLAENSHILIENDEWFKELIKVSNVSQPTLYNWWNAFCREANVSLRPRQANDLLKQQFYAWLEQQQTKEEAEQQRRREEIRQEKQVRDFLDAQETLQGLLEEYGQEAVFYGVVCAVFPELAPRGLPPARSTVGAKEHE
jgi:ParB-like nuclease domain